MIVAFSGLVLVLFLIGHMLGNLSIYFGSDALNSYAHWLQSSPALWLVRGLMVLIVLLHMLIAMQVSQENRQARRQNYRRCENRFLWLYNRRMVFSGLVVLIFIFVHVGHLTLGIGIGHLVGMLDSQGHVHVYNRIVGSFQSPLLAWGYVIGMLFVAVHLKHSIRGMFQTLGFFNENYFTFFEALSWMIALAVLGGLISIPLAAQFGLLQLDPVAAAASFLLPGGIV